MAIGVRRLNHAVLYVSELERAVAFYRDVFGFEEIARLGDMAAFMRAGGSDNHHDLGRYEREAPIMPLDLERELARYGSRG